MFARTCATRTSDCAGDRPGTRCTITRTTFTTARRRAMRATTALSVARRRRERARGRAGQRQPQRVGLHRPAPARDLASTARARRAPRSRPARRQRTLHQQTGARRGHLHAHRASGCGFVDTFKYTADLGGGVTDNATVRIVIKCVCGDGVLDGGEQCDLGSEQRRPAGRCSTSCRQRGQRPVRRRQVRSQPAAKSATTATTSKRATAAARDLLAARLGVCGDGTRSRASRSATTATRCSGDGCNANCTSPSCGDGRVDLDNASGPEQCDDGPQQRRRRATTCSTLCTTTAQCGNNQIELGEQCDDGNIAAGRRLRSAPARSRARAATVAIESGEQCDRQLRRPAVRRATAARICLCANYCGDGRHRRAASSATTATVVGGRLQRRLHPTAAAATQASTARPAASSATTATPTRPTAAPTTASSRSCAATACKEGGEECDDGNNLSGDGCSSTCRSESERVRQRRTSRSPSSATTATRPTATAAAASACRRAATAATARGRRRDVRRRQHRGRRRLRHRLRHGHPDLSLASSAAAATSTRPRACQSEGLRSGCSFEGNSVAHQATLPGSARRRARQGWCSNPAIGAPL